VLTFAAAQWKMGAPSTFGAHVRLPLGGSTGGEMLSWSLKRLNIKFGSSGGLTSRGRGP
jgi:hypothetical protein